VQLRQRFRFLLGIQFAMTISLAMLTAGLFWNQEALSRAQQVHFQSYQLADELRQSSDDLTRLARSYVATGNEEFEREYWAVLDIRNGKIPRPMDYHRIYWDLVTTDRPKPRPDGPAIALRELMIREGFTDAEFAKLAAAQKYSDALVQTEKIAMNAVRGLFDDGTGSFIVKRAPDRALAMTLMNDEAYHDNKARIMRPIDDFYVMFARRTAGEVAKFERRSLTLLSGMGVNIAAILGMFVYSFVRLRKQMVEREHAEDALRASEARYRLLNTELEQRVALRTSELAARNRETQALLDSIPDTVLLCDERGAVLSSHSPAGQPDLNRSANAPADASRDSFLQEIAREIHGAVQSGDQAVLREFDRQLNGAAISIEARATRVGPDRVLILVRDISARKRMEQDVRDHLDRERLLSEMKSQFITVASHEFRTPLAAAVGSVELLERHAGRLTETKRGELLTRIKHALDRLTVIMNDMVMLSRADSGQVKVTRMEVDLARFVMDVIQSAEANDRQQHTFSFQQTGGSSVVPADTNLLHHVLSNLIGNSLRYSPAGTQVAIVLAVGEQAFELTVADEGIGIPEAERDRIFEPFVRGSNVGQIAGTGLGLNLARRYADLMGGRIELLPTERGAAFRVSVPLQQPPV
jgi:signal transduction histidine kinase